MWFFSSKKQRSAKGPRRPRAFRPTVKTLEDRFLLSASPLDPTFGSGGIVTTQIGSGSDAYAVALQADGKIVVGGSAATASGDVFALARYTTSGGLDSTFGSGGMVTTNFGKKTSADAVAMAVYPTTGTSNDGKIVLAGYEYSSSSGWYLAVARYKTNGSLDSTFGSGGLVKTAINGSYGPHDGAVTLQPDGKIIVAAVSAPSGSSVYHTTLARYNANGTLDPTFGTSGVVISQVGNGDSDARALALQNDGTIVVGGWIVVNNQGLFTVTRYNANGSLDTTFGNGNGYAGFSVQSSIIYDGVYSVLIQPTDGKIVAGGSVQPPSQLRHWELARFNADGSSDTTFGASGVVDLPGLPGDLRAVALQSNGQIMVAGVVFSASLAHTFEVGRLNADGSLDTTFNGTGLVNTPIGNSADAKAAAIQPADGKIVVAGSSPWNTSGPSGDSFALARYVTTDPSIGSFTASANPVTSGSSETLTVSNITDSNPSATITQVAFYYFDSTGAQQVLGYGTQSSPGVWTLTFTVTLMPGSYTIYAQAQDNYGLFSDPFALALTVQ